MSDCQTYVKTLHQMHIHTLCLIFVPDMFLSPPDAALALSRKRLVSPSLLIEYIGEEFPGIHVESVGGGIGTIVVVSPSLVIYCISASNTFYRSRILLQLCVEDKECAGMILAVSNKYVVPTPTLIHLNLEPQVLCPLCRLCPLQICALLCSGFSSNSLCACGGHYDC